MKSFENLIEAIGDEKVVENFKWKFPFSAISFPFFGGENSKVSNVQLHQLYVNFKKLGRFIKQDILKKNSKLSGFLEFMP